MRLFPGMGFRYLIFSFVAVGFLGLSAEAAAEDDVLYATVVNTAGDSGSSAERALIGVLESADRVEPVDSTEFLEIGESHGFDSETLRKGSQRTRHVREFAAAMSEADVDGVLVLDVFSGTAQVVTIGPEGEELSDVRRDLSGKNLPQDRAVSILEESFATLVPAWKEHKKESSREESSEGTDLHAADEQSDVERIGSEDEDSEATDSGSNEDGEEMLGSSEGGQSGSSTVLETGFDFWFGALLGYHSLRVESESEYSLNNGVPMSGLGFEIDAVLGRFAESSSGFGLDVFGAYAPFGVQLDGGSSSEILTGKFTQLGLDLNYLNQLSRRISMTLGAGFEVLSLMVASNSSYTGNRYAQLRFTGGLDYEVTSFLALGAAAGAAPVLHADMSGGAFSDNAFSTGLLGEASLALTFWKAVGAEFGYRLYSYDVIFHESERADGRTSAKDVYHVGDIRFSYDF